ncbi:MAG TPA: response regulator [Vicinamibacterales bacterium]|nr:response regulator [Vicinamibacterales bacterium]
MIRPFVLVVEDEPAVRGPLEKFLTIHGFDVRGVDAADKALDAIAERRPDAAVVDLRLPGGSGRDVVLSIPPPTPVIIFSAVPDESGGLERLRANTRLILKPFSLVMLAETLRRMVDAVPRASRAVR